MTPITGLTYSVLQERYKKVIHALGIDTRYTLKTIRRHVATIEYFKAMEKDFRNKGGKAL